MKGNASVQTLLAVSFTVVIIEPPAGESKCLIQFCVWGNRVRSPRARASVTRPWQHFDQTVTKPLANPDQIVPSLLPNSFHILTRRTLYRDHINTRPGFRRRVEEGAIRDARDRPAAIPLPRDVASLRHLQSIQSDAREAGRQSIYQPLLGGMAHPHHHSLSLPTSALLIYRFSESLPRKFIECYCILF